MATPILADRDTQLNSQTKRKIPPLREARARALVNHLIEVELHRDQTALFQPVRYPWTSNCTTA
jgi:hypothetical protein